MLQVTAGCAGGAAAKPRRACIEVTASETLHFYDGQPHSLTLFLYPLSGALGFEQASILDLLEGESPPGVVGPRAHVTVSPGESRRIEQAFPQTAAFTGVVANYYREAGDPEGSRRAVVPARCGWRTPEIRLSPSDLVIDR